MHYKNIYLKINVIKPYWFAHLIFRIGTTWFNSV